MILFMCICLYAIVENFEGLNIIWNSRDWLMDYIKQWFSILWWCYYVWYNFFGCVGMIESRKLEFKGTLMAEIAFLPSSVGWRASPRWRVTCHAPQATDGHQWYDRESVMVSRLSFSSRSSLWWWFGGFTGWWASPWWWAARCLVRVVRAYFRCFSIVWSLISVCLPMLRLLVNYYELN